jgi:signal transduction histidine kinase
MRPLNKVTILFPVGCKKRIQEFLTMTLRRLYIIDGWLMIAVGILFFYWVANLASWFGMDTSGPISTNLDLWRGISYGGVFGGALIAFGLAALAMTKSRDPEFHRAAGWYFLTGHAAMAFIVWAKQVALWRTTMGFALLDVMTIAFAAFLYTLVVNSAASGPGKIRGTKREEQIREVAGQEERNRLAQDLHDSVKQQIYSIHTNLAAAQARWDNDTGGAREAVDHARTAARDAMAEMIAMLDRLRQDSIESVGLVEALRRQSEALGFQSGAEVTTRMGALPEGDRLKPGALGCVFRIAQEALANIARHARAKHVEISIAMDKSGNQFVLKIHDDGQGFDKTAPQSGMGLANMKARAKEIDAILNVESKAGEGSTVILRLPLLDPLAEKQRRYVFRWLVPFVLSGFATILLVAPWREWRLNLLPLVAFGWAFVAWHTVILVRLLWQKPARQDS